MRFCAFFAGRSSESRAEEREQAGEEGECAPHVAAAELPEESPETGGFGICIGGLLACGSRGGSEAFHELRIDGAKNFGEQDEIAEGVDARGRVGGGGNGS